MEQNAHNSIAATDLRMPDIKTYLYETVGKVIEADGYKFKKSNFSFRRKHDKNYEAVYFLFYNYFPLNYQVHFLLEVWNNEIEVVKITFPYKQNIENFNFRSISIPMGEFVDEERIRGQMQKYDQGFVLDRVTGEFVKDESAGGRKNLTWAQIAGHSCELVTSKDLFKASEEMKKILEQQAMPLSNQLSTVGGIDDFFASRPGWSVKSLSLNNMASELIAAKLNAKRDYHEVFKQIGQVIDERIATKAMSQETKKVMDELYKFLQKA
jgi:hypothetical protein